MTDIERPQFRIDEEGVPWAGDKKLVWARNVRNEVRPSVHSAFGIAEHYSRGFHLPFENGWTISCQWGWGNYCSNRSPLFIDDPDPGDTNVSPDAEILVLDKDGIWAILHDEPCSGEPYCGDIVRGYVTVEEFLRLAIEVAQWSTTEPSPPHHFEAADRELTS